MSEPPFLLSPMMRRAAFASAMALLLLVLTATVLEPSASGIGTHQQLGMPRCVWLRLMEIRCPSCGMTTSWALAMDGRLEEALHANPGGVLLLMQALLSIPVFLWMGITSQTTPSAWFSRFSAAMFIAALVVAFIHWISFFKLG